MKTQEWDSKAFVEVNGNWKSEYDLTVERAAGTAVCDWLLNLSVNIMAAKFMFSFRPMCFSKRLLIHLTVQRGSESQLQEVQLSLVVRQGNCKKKKKRLILLSLF